VSPSGFYAWRTREPSARARKDVELRVLIRASFEKSRRTYGSIRIHEDLVETGEHVGRNRVIRIMQDEGIRARARKRWKSTTMSEHDQPIAPNVLSRDFEARRRTSAGSATTRYSDETAASSTSRPSSACTRASVGWAVVRSATGT
jgi:putative transposase